MLHLGQLIRAQFDELPKKYTIQWLARLLRYKRDNIYKIFAKENLDTGLLMRLSLILDHDFFAELSREYQRLKNIGYEFEESTSGVKNQDLDLPPGGKG